MYDSHVLALVMFVACNICGSTEHPAITCPAAPSGGKGKGGRAKGGKGKGGKKGKVK